MKSSEENVPLVSIVVPAYNVASYVEETMRSLTAQTYPALEIIVVNDGSTDDTLQRIVPFAQADSRITLFSQQNGGLSCARNSAVARVRGKYIMPVDADDVLLPGFLEWAVPEMEKDEEVKVVIPKAEFFGARSGTWKLAPFSLRRLARMNMIPATSLYRRADWERCGGYNEVMQSREDWQFWIAVLKDGGRVLTSPHLALRYRVRPGSLRLSDRGRKRLLVDTLNERHPEFFQRHLNGPLRYNRSWSALLNRLHRLVYPSKLKVAAGFGDCADFFRAMPAIFSTPRGEIIHDRRNQLRRMSYGGHRFVVKSYKVPHLVNRLVYGMFRPCKAKRAFEYAELLRRQGIGSPRPVAYYTERLFGVFFGKSYFVSLESECPYTYEDVMHHRVEREDEVLQAIGELTARLHNAGMVHMDYSRGNILIGFGPGGEVRLELIDLNRIRFRTLSVKEGLNNLFERLPVDCHQHAVMKKAYIHGRTMA